jgi:hypothetical protein
MKNLMFTLLFVISFYQLTFPQKASSKDYYNHLNEREQFIATQHNLSELNNVSKLINSNVNYTNLDSTISNIITNISIDSITSYIQHLQNFDSRLMLLPNRFEVSDWLKDKFISMGFNDVEFDTFYAHTTISNFGLDFDTVTTQRNVIATLPGSVYPEQVYIFCGHYDSFNQTDNPMIYAPGADDNASGTATVLEIARAMMISNYQPESTIKFIAFAAEELMFFGDGGSEHYALEAYNTGMDIRMVNNHDMISYTSQPLEESYVNIGFNPGSQDLSEIGVSCIDRYTSINVNSYGYAGADLGPFDNLGYKGVYFEESEFSPFYHSGNDVIGNYNMEFCTEVIKASCATLISGMILPTPVDEIFFTDQADGSTLKIDWNPTNDEDFNHYNIYVGTETGIYDRSFQTSETSYIIDNLESEILYYFGVSIVDNDGYESYIFESIYVPFTFTLDQGILVIDDTFNGTGALTNPTDEEVDNYFRDVLNDFEINNYDLILSPNILVSDIGKYSTVIWHKNDNRSTSILSSFAATLQRYLNAGGNFLFTGFKPSKLFEGNNAYSRTFTEGDFLYDFLKIENVTHTFGSRFIGATAKPEDYFDVHVDTTKTTDRTNYHLRNIESLDANTDGNNIFFYDTNFDSSTSAGSMFNLSVGVEYLGNDYKVVTLSFPLYYMEKEKTEQLLYYILNVKFNEVTSMDEHKELVIKKYRLFQNYPNPFNPETKISYKIPEASFVSLKVYDVLGNKVASLVNEDKPVGEYEIEFDGREYTSGIYFYQLITGDYTETKKMVLLK